MSAIVNGTLIYVGIGVGVNVLSYFIPACKADQSCAMHHATATASAATIIILLP